MPPSTPSRPATASQPTSCPPATWSGATAHIRGMRWYILNRTVTGDSGNALTLNAGAGCWGGDCTGWGFWLDGDLKTLDREWHYDAAAGKVYLYSTADPNSALIEGSVDRRRVGKSGRRDPGAASGRNTLRMS